MRRKIIKIDEEKCTGCGKCIPDCPEGALQIIDGKARLISDLFCDGLGACVGSCPEEAIITEERDAEPYDEKKVMEKIAAGGENTVRAHLKHLLDHGEKEYFRQAMEVLKNKGIQMEAEFINNIPCACPGSKAVDLQRTSSEDSFAEDTPSQLRHWPVQLHLVSPNAPYFKEADVVLSADCAAYAAGDFHRRFLKGKSVSIACPKLDADRERYTEKIRALADEAQINTLNVLIMEVPCCRGLLALAKEGLEKAKRKVPLKLTVMGINGKVVSEEWL